MADEVLTVDDNGRNVGGAIGDSSEILAFRLDSTSKTLRINNWVWNAVSLAWERMKQPTLAVGDLTVTMGDIEALLADNYWKRILIDNTTGDIDYIGKHTVLATATSTATWHVWRYQDYSGSLSRDIQGPLVGSWTGRAALGWQ